MFEDTKKREKKQQAQAYSAQIEGKLFEQLKEVLFVLDHLLDRRLVVTFFGLVVALFLHRHRNEGGWMSELGSSLMPENAEAGRKRIERLLYSRKWDHRLLKEALWRRGDERVEKPESLQLEGLGPVRSSKAVRLKRIKPGYFNPPVLKRCI